jgi:hypothetical protein
MQMVRVTTSDGRLKRFERGDTIELTVVPGVYIAVEDIFTSDE